MRIFLKSFLLFALIFSAAYMVRILIVPDVVPIADGEQSGWQIQIAFCFDCRCKISVYSEWAS